MRADTSIASAGQRLAFPPPPALARVVRYVHVERDSGGLVLVPATPNAMLTFFLSGGLAGVPAPWAGAPILSGPLGAPQPACWLPGTSFVTVHLAPQWLPLLFDVDAAALANLAVPLADTGAGLDAARMQDALLSEPAPAEWAARLCRWLTTRLARFDGRIEPFVIPARLLQQETAEIAACVGLGVRQLERRYLAAYGQSIRASRRMQRYVHALAQLLTAAPSHGRLTAIAMDAGYHDQAHMIRDFSHFTAMAPGALLRALAGDDARLRLYRYDAAQRAVVLARP